MFIPPKYPNWVAETGESGRMALRYASCQGRFMYQYRWKTLRVSHKCIASLTASHMLMIGLWRRSPTSTAKQNDSLQTLQLFLRYCEEHELMRYQYQDDWNLTKTENHNVSCNIYTLHIRSAQLTHQSPNNLPPRAKRTCGGSTPGWAYFLASYLAPQITVKTVWKTVSEATADFPIMKQSPRSWKVPFKPGNHHSAIIEEEPAKCNTT